MIFHDFVSCVTHASPEWCLLRVPTNQPPKRAEERPRKTPHTSVFSRELRLVFCFGGRYMLHTTLMVRKKSPLFHQVDIVNISTLFTRVSVSYMLGGCLGFRESTVVPLFFEKGSWESRISPSHLLYPWTFDSQFQNISTTTTMPCDCPGKLRSWVAERVKTVFLHAQAKGGKTKINMQLVQLTKKWNNVSFSNTCFMFSLVGTILQKCYFSGYE